MKIFPWCTKYVMTNFHIFCIVFEIWASKLRKQQTIHNFGIFYSKLLILIYFIKLFCSCCQKLNKFIFRFKLLSYYIWLNIAHTQLPPKSNRCKSVYIFIINYNLRFIAADLFMSTVQSAILFISMPKMMISHSLDSNHSLQ